MAFHFLHEHNGKETKAVAHVESGRRNVLETFVGIQTFFLVGAS